MKRVLRPPLVYIPILSGASFLLLAWFDLCLRLLKTGTEFARGCMLIYLESFSEAR